MTSSKPEPPFKFYRTGDCISLERDGILFRIFPKPLKFQLDRLGDINNKKVDEEFSKIQTQSSIKKSVYGVFGYIKLKKVSHLILIEKASVVGSILKGKVYRVDKLMFVPLSYSANIKIDEADQEYVEMIQKIQSEKAFYFAYEFDLTKNV